MLELAGRTPFVIRGQLHQLVMHWIVMRVMQSGQITLLECQVGFAEVVPYFSAWHSVEAIEISGDIRVQMLEEFA